MGTSSLPDNLVYGNINKVNVEPCPYCVENNNVKEMFISKHMRITLIENSMLIVTSEIPWGFADVRINFCPMCGRKLED